MDYFVTVLTLENWFWILAFAAIVLYFVFGPIWLMLRNWWSKLKRMLGLADD